MNIDRQHASWRSGSSLCSSFISSSFELLLSNSKRSPRSVHLGAKLLMMWIFSPLVADFRTFSLAIVGAQFRSIGLCSV